MNSMCIVYDLSNVICMYTSCKVKPLLNSFLFNQKFDIINKISNQLTLRIKNKSILIQINPFT
jgi:hypothetical protein